MNIGLSYPAWDDLPTLGKRLNRLIKYSETMLKKTEKDDHDSKARYISTIVSLTRQQLEIIKTNEALEKIKKWFDQFDKAELKSKRETVHEMNNVIEMAETSDERKTKGR